MHFVYHPHHEAIIVTPEEYPQYLANGWYDTPAKFPKNIAVEPVAEAAPEMELQPEPVESAPKKKGRPPKAKAEDVSASVED